MRCRNIEQIIFIHRGVGKSGAVFVAPRSTVAGPDQASRALSYSSSQSILRDPCRGRDLSAIVNESGGSDLPPLRSDLRARPLPGAGEYSGDSERNAARDGGGAPQ